MRRILHLTFSRVGLAYLAMGVVLTRAMLFGEIHPYGPAYLAAVVATNRALLWPLTLAMILAGVLNGAGMALAINLLLLGTMLQFFPMSLQSRWQTAPLLVLAAGLISRVLPPVLEGALLPVFAGAMIEVLLAAALALALLVAAVAVQEDRWLRGLSTEEWVCLAVLLLGLLAGLTGLTSFGVSVSGLVGRVVVMLAAIAAGSGAGAAVGVVAGLAFRMMGMAAFTQMGTYALIGLLAGMLRRFGRWGPAAGMLLGQLLLAAYLPDLKALGTVLLESLLAAGILLLLPANWVEKCSLAAATTAMYARDQGAKTEWLRLLVAARLQELGHLFGELSQVFHREQAAAEPDRTAAADRLLQDVAAFVCNDCSLYAVCWKRDLATTSRRLRELLTVGEAKEALKDVDLPPDIARRCSRAGELMAVINCLLASGRREREWRRLLVDTQDMVSTQLTGLSGLMQDLGSELKLEAGFHEELEVAAAGELQRCGVLLKSLAAVCSARGQLEVTARMAACQGEMGCQAVVAPVVARLAGQRLSVRFRNCALQTEAAECVFDLVPAPAFEVANGFAQVPKSGNEVCGDRHAVLPVPGGRYALLLSDGMGVGGGAAYESAATVSLLGRLLTAGFERNLAVRAVNSVLAARATKDTFATLDLAVINLHSGQAEFTKIGAAPAYIKRGRQVIRLHARTLPIGILKQVETETLQEALRADDLLVMITDGVQEAGRSETAAEDWLAVLLEQSSTDDPQDLADQVLHRALTRCGLNPADDMSVLVARLLNRPC